MRISLTLLHLKNFKTFGEVSISPNDVSYELDQTVQDKFNRQKRNRSKFNDLEYTDVMRSRRRYGVFQTALIMSKPLITMFTLKLEEQLGRLLFLRDSSDDKEITSKLFLAYVGYLEDIGERYSLTNLFTQLGVLAEVNEETA